MIKRAFCVLMICLLLTIWAAGSVIPGMARDNETLLGCFNRFADTAHLGVEKAQYPLIAQKLAAFFRGETEDPNLPAQPFQAHEVTHLHDVRALMDGIFTVSFFSLACALWFILVLFLSLRRGKAQKENCPLAFADAWLTGFALYITAVIAVIIWAALDFNQLFVLLHELLFTNDLWLLNPQTDLLIALMPEGMFIHLGQQVLYHLLPLIALFSVIALIGETLRRKFQKPRQTT